MQTWHALWDEDTAAERPTRVTFDIEEDDGGVTRVTVTHELEGAPIHAAQVASTARLQQGGGGWNLILSDLKTLLETGSSFGGCGGSEGPPPGGPSGCRRASAGPSPRRSAGPAASRSRSGR